LTILFLGAGASAAFGYPTMPALSKQLREMIEGKERDLLNHLLPPFPETEGNDIEDVLQTIDLMEELSRRRIASALEKSYLQLSAYANNRSMPFGEALSVCRNLKDKLQDAIFDIFQFRTSTQAHFKLYDDLLSILRDHVPRSDYSIFTTNYDRIVEHYCLDRRVLLVNGFRGNQLHTEWRPDLFDQPAMEQAILVRLYKLHGSLSWKLSDFGIEEVATEVRFPQPRGIYKRDILIYPGAKERPDQEPFRTLYDRFENAMKAFRRCLVIGYSFRDAYLNRVFLDLVIRWQGQLLCMSKNCKAAAMRLLSLKEVDDVENYVESNRLVLVPTHLGDSGWQSQLTNALRTPIPGSSIDAMSP
jgi:hypothetical protein